MSRSTLCAVFQHLLVFPHSFKTFLFFLFEMAFCTCVNQEKRKASIPP